MILVLCAWCGADYDCDCLKPSEDVSPLRERMTPEAFRKMVFSKEYAEHMSAFSTWMWSTDYPPVLNHA